jgi:membrane-associated phospholipid phosphatase
MKKILNIIGTTAPYTLFITSIFLLRNLKYYLIFYILGFGLNNILNIILKLSIKEPRPKDETKFLEFIGNHIGYDKYGMPSRHAQNCFFSLVYVTLALNQPFITLLYVGISFICLIQRYEYKNHTLTQLFVGSIVGSLFAYLIYFFSGKYILGKVNYKKDDGFFIR